MDTPHPADRRATVGVAVAILAAASASLYAQFELWTWYIEDAAISFSYARNLAEGWGLARFPGDERIEGYSNPLWVLWMALWERFGVTAWTSSKWTGAGLVAVTLPAAYVATRTAGGRFWGVVAAVLLALDASFVIWSASGLENSLFCALLALGIARTLLEAQPGRWPLAVLCWLGLAITRPEGIVYAALGGFWALVQEATGERRWGRIAWWLAAFFVPFLAYHAIRYDYFAHPLPATYYAKIGDDPFRWTQWNGRGWVYVRRYAEELGRFWFAPMVLLAVTGARGWRGAVALGLSVWLGVVLLYPGVEPFIGWGWIDAARHEPWWVQVRLASIAAIVGATTLLGLGREGWRTRLLPWMALLIGLLFTLRSQGDWMRGYRWLSLVSVPTAMLLALGLREVFQVLERRSVRFGGVAGGAVVTALAAGLVWPQVDYLADYRPETTPNSVRKRVNHYADAMLWLHLDRVDILDHDMGAMMWWGRDLGIIRDTKGLIDIAYARHRRHRRFVEEYAFDEYPFDFAHAHGSTGPAVRMLGARWRDNYIEFPGYGRGESLHVGNFVRKSALMGPWTGSDTRTASFTGGGRQVELLGLDFPARETYGGTWLYLEFGLRVSGRTDGVRPLLFLYDDTGVVHTWHLPLGMDDWYPVEDWSSGETANTRLAVVTPRGLPRGTYGVGMVILTPDGILPADDPTDDPVYAVGEVRFDDAILVVRRDVVRTDRKQWLGRAVARADDDRCEDAIAAWKLARARRSMDPEWNAEKRAWVGGPIARCFARRAAGADRPRAVAAMREARRWAPTDPEVLATGVALADPWMAEADALRERGIAAHEVEPAEGMEAIEAAYARYRDVMFVDPSRAWARRHAEDLRVIRLNMRR